jgi:hypothetical protein
MTREGEGAVVLDPKTNLPPPRAPNLPLLLAAKPKRTGRNHQKERTAMQGERERGQGEREWVQEMWWLV